MINGVNMKLQCELKSIKQGNKSYTFLNLRKAALEWEEMLGEEMQCEIFKLYVEITANEELEKEIRRLKFELKKVKEDRDQLYQQVQYHQHQLPQHKVPHHQVSQHQIQQQTLTKMIRNYFKGANIIIDTTYRIQEVGIKNPNEK